MTVSPRASARAYAPAPLSWTDLDQWVRQTAEVVNSVQRGKINSTGTLTLTISAASSTLAHSDIGPNSVILFMPTTANAAAEIGAGGFYVSSRGDQTATVTHANNTNADRTFAFAIFG